MRGFWASTLGFFMAFIGWFAMAPLITTIKKDLNLTKDEVYNSNILGVAATIPARLIIGPLCDRFGPRKPMAWTLILCALPLGCAALVQDATGLYITRFLIGFAGATFVPCQYWTTALFTGRIVGSANALAGGWGNLGGGVTQGLSVGIMEMFKAMGLSTSMAWRMTLVVPAVLWVIVAIMILFLADDCPAGKWRDRKVEDSGTKYSLWKGLKEVFKQPFTYFLIASYACGFGVELHVNKSIAAYFETQWKLETSTAGLIATFSGLMNMFSRFMGGWLSDQAARRAYLRGRMWVIFVSLVLSGSLLCVMSAMRDLWAAIFLLILFSIFCQASCGAVYGLVPFVSLQYGGILSGLVGGGGNLGAVCWGFVQKTYGNQNQEPTAYMVIGLVAIASAFLLFCGRLHGAALLPCIGGTGEEREKELCKAKADPGLEKDPEMPSSTRTSEEGKVEEDDDDVYALTLPHDMPYSPSPVDSSMDAVLPYLPPTPQPAVLSEFEPHGLHSDSPRRL